MSTGASAHKSSKRKRDSDDHQLQSAEQTASTSIKLRALPGSAGTSREPVEITPKLLVPSHFLSIADIRSEKSRPKCLYTAQIDVLEGSPTEHGDENGGGAVLVANSTGSDTVYAVERVGKRRYSLTPLKGWVSLESPSQPRHSKKKDADENAKRRASEDAGKPWWDKAAASLPSKDITISQTASKTSSRTPTGMDAHPTKSRKPGATTAAVADSTPRAAPIIISTPAPVPDQTPDQASNQALDQTPTPTPTPKQALASLPTPAVALPDVRDASIQTSWEEVTTTLRSKYLEALYASKTSLAYFAKGPLSRARNASAGILEGEQTGFCKLLAEMTMSIATSDKKYSSALPELINEIPVGLSQADLRTQSMSDMQSTIKKSRKRKKMSKHGFLPTEEEYVCQWWLEKENSTEAVSVDLPHKVRISSSLKKQRARETQLQVMIVLESLALQDMKSGGADQTAKENPVDEDSSKPFGHHPKRAKKSLDMQALLDLLVDRLCIWQTTELDDVEEYFDNSSMAKSSSGSGSGSSSSSKSKSLLQATKTNVLQDFCTEVLVPFYASRLPATFTSLCRKMGTVGVASPARAAIKRIGSGGSQTQVIKPGSAMSRRGLKRVATDGSTSISAVTTTTTTTTTSSSSSSSTTTSSTKRLPSLARSATDSSALHVKRESTDLLLQDIPLHKPTVLQDRRFSQREVDIVAISKATKARMERKAFLDKELASAIDVLKKPNSRAAVRELVDLADGRNAGSSAAVKIASKRKREPMRNNSSSNSSGGGGRGGGGASGGSGGGSGNSNNYDGNSSSSFSFSNGHSNSNGVHVKATPRPKRVLLLPPQGQEAPALAHGSQGPSDQLKEFLPASSSKRLPAAKLLPVIRSAALAVANPAFTVEATPMKQRYHQRQHRQQTGTSSNFLSSATEAANHDAMQITVEATPSRGVAGRTMLLDAKLLAAAYAEEVAEKEDEEEVGKEDEEKDDNNINDDLDGAGAFDNDDDDDYRMSGPSPAKVRKPASSRPAINLFAESPVRKKARGVYLMPSMTPSSSFQISATPPKPSSSSTTSQQVVTARETTWKIHANVSVTGSALAPVYDRSGEMEEKERELRAGGGEHSAEEDEDVYKSLGWDVVDDV